jgi:hypothetical protein
MLVEHYANGDKLADIAAELARSMNGVACRVAIKGLNRPQPQRKTVPEWHVKGNDFVGFEAACLGRG